ncbi:MAG: hypothetical protein PUA75_05435 [Clostridiales bacterium]|nr:hypothetical protein [Clostridiales bacterium]
MIKNEIMMSELQYITLREKAELKDNAALWFHSKWGVPNNGHFVCNQVFRA